MPYDGEYAQYKTIKRLVENPRIEDLLKNSKIRRREEDTGVEPPPTVDVKPSGRTPKYVIAIDGSKQETRVENGFPGAEIGYITIAAVALDVELMKTLDAQRPVSPKVFRETEKASSSDSVFPGCNVVFGEDVAPRISLRRALFDHLKSERIWSDGETFLETYEALLEYKPLSDAPECPYLDNCPDAKAHRYSPSKGAFECPCPEKQLLYSTDALRIHERMEERGSNASIFAEIMQVLERLGFINILRNLEQKNSLSSLKRIAFALDGPLAVFGQPAWLSAAIQKELSRINRKAKTVNGEDVLIIGIEKTGNFQEHLVALDTNVDGSVGKIENQTVMLLTNGYIRKNIVFSDSNRPYGEATYFGRKFFYRSKAGSLIVGMLPFLEDGHKNLDRATPDQFPRLADALSVLDELHCSRYPNALIPLVAAHAEAAIPMNLGAKILEQLARELMGTT